MANQNPKGDLDLRAGMVFPRYFYFMEGKGSGISNSNYKVDKGLFLDLSGPIYKSLEIIAGFQILKQKFDVKTYQRYYYDPIRIKHSATLYVVNIGLSQAVFNKKYLKMNVMAGLMPTRIKDYQSKIYTDSGNMLQRDPRSVYREVQSILLTYYAGFEFKKKIVKDLSAMLQGTMVFQTLSNKRTVLYTINRFNLSLGLVYHINKNKNRSQ